MAYVLLVMFEHMCVSEKLSGVNKVGNEPWMDLVGLCSFHDWRV